MNTLYTVRKCRKDDSLYGDIHGCDNIEKTVCGLDIDENYWIVSNAFDGEITCKYCLQVMKKYPTIPQRLKK